MTTASRKGKGTQLRKQLDALNETVGTKLITILANQSTDRQGLAKNAVRVILLQNEIERFRQNLEIIFEVS